MSMTIFRNKTLNGLVVDDMVDNNDDTIYLFNGHEAFFTRFTVVQTSDDAELHVPALAAFARQAPYTALYAELDVPSEGYDCEEIMQRFFDRFLREYGDNADILLSRVEELNKD